MDTITISRIRIDLPSSHTTKTTLRQQAPALPTCETSAGPMRGEISSWTASLGCSWIAFDHAARRHQLGQVLQQSNGPAAATVLELATAGRSVW